MSIGRLIRFSNNSLAASLIRAHPDAVGIVIDSHVVADDQLFEIFFQGKLVVVFGREVVFVDE